MPSFRSDAEAEIRDAVVAKLRLIRPHARIIHEINCQQGGNRMDLIAVSPAEIIAVEIKSRKDKLTRLPAQITAMRGASHHVIAALHEKFLVAHRWRETWLDAPAEALGATVWAFPETDKGRSFSCGPWALHGAVQAYSLPGEAIHMLWHAELVGLCSTLGVPVKKRPTMRDMTMALRWNCTGKDLTHGICAALRARASIEADPPC